MEYESIKYGDGHIKLFNSHKARRLEEHGETYEEYKIRQKAINSYMKNRKSMKHVATMLIPKMKENGELDLGPNNKPQYIGKTKGNSYVKDKKELKEEHMELL